VREKGFAQIIVIALIGILIIIIGTIVYIGFRFRTSSHDFAELSNQFPDESLNLAPCDINGDGKCNDADIESLNKAMGTYRGQNDYNPLADLDADGVINDNDRQLHLKLLDQNQKDETANWKTNSNDYNVSYKYPGDWEYKGLSADMGCIPDVGPVGDKNTGFDICGAVSGAGPLSVEDEAAESAGTGEVLNKRNITLDGQEAIQQTVKFKDGTIGIQAFVQYEDKAFGKTLTLDLIGLNPENKYSESDFEKIFNQILSTFKLLD